jgi:proteic killer suppression protein
LLIIRKKGLFLQHKKAKMNIKFDDKALEDLYVNGTTKDHKYKKLSQDVVKQYIKAVNYIKAVRRIEDLYTIKSLHYEKKKGDLKGVETVWLNAQYRLFFKSSPDDNGIIVNALLQEISKHYE